MKNTGRTATKKPYPSVARRFGTTTAPKTQRHSKVSSVGRSVKKYGKQTLRDLLLSKTFYAVTKIVIGIFISSTALYAAYAFIGNSIEHDVVISQSEILSRVGKHLELPAGEAESIVRVQDPENLKHQNDLFENVKEGDYIIIYPTLAVVYDLRNDHIVAMRSTRR
jgi:hypothetical protein